jgi:hypothetical protein
MRLRYALLAGCAAMLLGFAGCGSTQPAPASAPPGAHGEQPIRAWRMKDFLVDHRALAQKALSYDELAEWIAIFFRTDERCRPITIIDSPQMVVLPMSINLFSVVLPQDLATFCGAAPEPTTCSSLRDNCRVIETSIFCDERLLRRLQFDAAVTYTYAHLSTVSKVKADPVQPLLFPAMPKEMLTSLAIFHAGARAGRDDVPAGLPFAMNYAQRYGSQAYAAMNMFLMSMVLGHEYAHIEQNACPVAIDAELQASKQMLDRYVDLTCSTTDKRELAADLRGIDLALQAAKGIADKVPARVQGREMKLGDKGTSSSVEATAVKRVDSGLHLMMIAGLQEFAEDDAIVAEWGGESVRRVDQEPAAGDALMRYYLQAAGDDPGIESGGLHMLPSIRALILLSKLHDAARAEAQATQGVAIAAKRLYGLMIGQLVAVQRRNCVPPRHETRSPEEAQRRTMQFIRTLFAATE